jgi:hypothetical protein
MSRRQPFSAFGATSLEHETSVLARHASAEAMRLCASSVVRLKGALGHRNEFSLKTKTLRLAARCVYVKESTRINTALKPISADQKNLCIIRGWIFR